MNEQNNSFRTHCCHVYIEGQGFAQPDYHLLERRTLRHLSACLGWALLAALVFSVLFPFYFLSMAQLVDPAVRFYNNQVVAKQAVFYLAGTVGYFFALVIPFFAVVTLNRIPSKVYMPSRKVRPIQVLEAVCLCMGTAVAGAFCAWLVAQAAGWFGLQPIAPDFPFASLDGLSLAILLVQVLLIAPLAEEFVFRGVLLGLLRRFGDGFAVLVSAFLFALFHRNMAQFPNAMLCGLVMGYAVVRTGSVWVGVLMHICNNFLAVGLTVFQSVEGGNCMVGLLLALMLLAGIAGLVLLIGSGRQLWQTRQTCFCGREKEKYRLFFGQAPQIICTVLMLAEILRNFRQI